MIHFHLLQLLVESSVQEIEDHSPENGTHCLPEATKLSQDLNQVDRLHQAKIHGVHAMLLTVGDRIELSDDRDSPVITRLEPVLFLNLEVN